MFARNALTYRGNRRNSAMKYCIPKEWTRSYMDSESREPAYQNDLAFIPMRDQ